jgi:hypothetical protein
MAIQGALVCDVPVVDLAMWDLERHLGLHLGLRDPGPIDGKSLRKFQRTITAPSTCRIRAPRDIGMWLVHIT